jgi:hypothetical protein
MVEISIQVGFFLLVPYAFSKVVMWHCRSLRLGLTPKARACKGVGQEKSLGVTFHVPGSVGECEGMNPTLPSELPLWKLEFRWILESSQGDYRGQNSLY